MCTFLHVLLFWPLGEAVGAIADGTL